MTIAGTLSHVKAVHYIDSIHILCTCNNKK